MKKIILVMLMLVNLVLVSAAGDELVVGMELEYPPFETIDKSGNPTGVSVELANSLSKKMGKKLRIENISYGGLIPALRSGKIDVIISSMSINETRAKSVDFSVPYASSPLVMLAYKDSKVQHYSDLDDSKVTIAVRTGNVAHLWVRANAPEANVRLFDKESQAVMDVSQGKSDVFIYDPQSIVRRQKKYSTTTRTIMDPLPGIGDWGMAVQKGNSVLLKEINEFIETAKTDGTFDRIRNEYLLEETKKFEEETGMKYFF